MTTRRRAGAGRKMAEQKDMKDLIVEALKPVREDISSLPDKKYIDDIVNKQTVQINKKIEAQNDKIKQLENRIEKLESQNLEERVQQLESELAIVQNLADRVDDAEQYSRRTCLRMYNIELPESGEKEDCLEKVGKVLQNMDCGVNIDSVDRAHRIGRKETDEEGKVRQQMIVKFNSFRDRTLVYRNRIEKNKVGNVKVRLDLTRKRLSVLRDAKEFIKGRNDVEFVFADINCSLVAKMNNGKFIFFDSVHTLEYKLK